MSSQQPGAPSAKGTVRPADPEPGATRDPGSGSSGVLGALLPAGQTFHGSDPDSVAAASICKITPTTCRARTRLYRDGILEREGFPVAEISDYLADDAVVIWLDLHDPDRSDLAVLSDEFGLHSVAI